MRTTQATNAIELESYRKLVDGKEEKQLYDHVLRARLAYWEQTEPMLTLAAGDIAIETRQLAVSKQAPLYDEFVKAVDQLIESVEKSAHEAAKATAALIARARLIGDVLVGIGIFIVSPDSA